MSTQRTITIGVISDTHGLLRPEAVAALRGSDLLIHAGDIGSPTILPELAKIAPVYAIRGNVDRMAWARDLPQNTVVEAGELLFYVLHDRNALDLDPRAAGFAAVVSGHSHQPGQEHVAGVLYFNPGSAGVRRFGLPVTVGRINIADRTVTAQVIELKV